MARIGSLLCDEELVEQGFLIELLDVGIFHPDDGVEITEVGLPFLVVVTRVRRFFAVRCRRGIDIDIVRQKIVEHRAGFACFDVDHHLEQRRR